MSKLFARAAGLAHRKALGIFGTDATDRPLYLYWPAAAEDETFSLPIRAAFGNQRTATENLPGMPGMVADVKTFIATTTLFPAGTRPDDNVIFLAGYSPAERRRYRIVPGSVMVSEAGGLTEFQGQAEE